LNFEVVFGYGFVLDGLEHFSKFDLFDLFDLLPHSGQRRKGIFSQKFWLKWSRFGWWILFWSNVEI